MDKEQETINRLDWVTKREVWYCFKWGQADWTGKTSFTFCKVPPAGTVFKMVGKGSRGKDEVEEIVGMRTRNVKFLIEIDVRCVTNSS